MNGERERKREEKKEPAVGSMVDKDEWREREKKRKKKKKYPAVELIGERKKEEKKERSCSGINGG